MRHVALGMKLLHTGEGRDVGEDFLARVVEHDQAVTELMRWLEENGSVPAPVELMLNLARYRAAVRVLMGPE